jgi:exopolysaccharide production protein ExoZ
MNRLAGLELLRGLAALLVLVGHIKYPIMSVLGEDAVPSFLAHFAGPFGVDLFFILSGYLIALTLERPNTTARTFFIARVARVAPLYFVVSLVCLALPGFRSYPMSPEMVFTTIFYLPILGDGLLPMSAHPYGWTLSFEMLFYLTATLFAAIVGPRRAVWCLIGFFALVPVAVALGNPWPTWAFGQFATSPLAMEFALGAIAYKTLHLWPRRVSVIALSLGVFGAIWSYGEMGRFGFIGDLLAQPMVALERVFTWGIPAWLIVVGAAKWEDDFGPLPAPKLTAWLGAVSYSLYLMQPFGFLMTILFATRFRLSDPWLIAFLGLVITTSLSAAASHWVDHPLHKFTKNRLTRYFPASSFNVAKRAWTFVSMKSRTLR